MTRHCSRTRTIHRGDWLTTGESPNSACESDNIYSGSCEHGLFTVGESLRFRGGFWRIFASIFARLLQQVKYALTFRAHLFHSLLEFCGRPSQTLGQR
jgi:hypothetical protein